MILYTPIVAYEVDYGEDEYVLDEVPQGNKWQVRLGRIEFKIKQYAKKRPQKKRDSMERFSRCVRK